MDSLTHIFIGAAIGEVTLGNKIGRKAALIGAFAKSIPDFDLFYTGLQDPWMYMCHHRGHTHSLIWETIYAFPLAWIFYKLFQTKEISFKRWLLLFLTCLWGHSLLDVCTNYGTRIFLPLTEHPYSWNNIAIVDLFFTLPMLILLIIGLFFHKLNPVRKKIMTGVLIYCFGYLGYTAYNKIQANKMFEDSLIAENIKTAKTMTNPVIFSNFLWYSVAVNDSNLYIAENSILYPSKSIRWKKFHRNKELLNRFATDEQKQRLEWFSQDFFVTENSNDTFNFYSAKFGAMNLKGRNPEETFVFHYQIAKDKTFGAKEPKITSEDLQKGIHELYFKIRGIGI
jgi:inner membrane protein